MTITRANVEAVLIRRVGKLLTATGLDGTTVDGTNDDLNDPIGKALRRMGRPVSSILAVADVDLAPVEAIDQLLDLAELRTLESIHTNLDRDDVTTSIGGDSKALSDIGKRIEARITALQAAIQREYQMDIGQTLTAGSLRLGFQEVAE